MMFCGCDIFVTSPPTPDTLVMDERVLGEWIGKDEGKDDEFRGQTLKDNDNPNVYAIARHHEIASFYLMRSATLEDAFWGFAKGHAEDGNKDYLLFFLEVGRQKMELRIPDIEKVENALAGSNIKYEIDKPSGGLSGLFAFKTIKLQSSWPEIVAFFDGKIDTVFTESPQLLFRTP